MNIPVVTASGHVIVRPGTTWERNGDDFYVPEFVNSLSMSKVLFARICKPGKSISERFADRYFDGFGFGALLYPDDLMDGSPEAFACASCLDHSSFLPVPYRELSELTAEQRAILRNAIVSVTRYCYLRTGDLVAVELSAPAPLCHRDCGIYTAEGEFGRFRLIF